MTTAASRIAAVGGECRPPARAGAPRRSTRGYATGKDDYLRRLRKIEGQVRGLRKMIENDTWCPDVVTQVGSATRALQEVAVSLLSNHVRHCVTSAIRASNAAGQEVTRRGHRHHPPDCQALGPGPALTGYRYEAYRRPAVRAVLTGHDAGEAAPGSGLRKR